MHRALWLLIGLDIRSGFRNAFRGKRSWRRIGLVILVFVFVGMIAASQYASVMLTSEGRESLRSVRFGAAMPFWALLYLLATWLTAAADRGLIMRPAEIHFLIAGPFTTREILTLNLIRLMYRALASASILAIVAWAYMPNFWSGFVGIWMVLVVSLLVGMIASLSARRALPQVVRTLRFMLSMTAIAVVVYMIAEAARIVTSESETLDFSKVAAAASDTRMGRAILPPVAWMFAPLQQSQFWPTVPLQILTRLPIIAALVAIVYAVGGAFGEAATERTDRAIARRQASLRSGTISSGRVIRQLAMPDLGRWGGVGSVAWLELNQAIRLMPRFMFYTATIITVILILPLVVNGERLDGLAGLGWMAGLTLYADFLLLLQFPVGFLGPVSQRVTLKLLPLPAWRIVLGALAGPMLPIVFTHTLVAALFLYLLKGQRYEVLQVAIALLPTSFVLTATIHLLGLWDIIKPRALQQRDALAAGRAMLSVWLFTFMMVPSIVIASICSLLLGIVSNTFEGYLWGAVIGMLLSAAGLLTALAYFFERWQPSAGLVEEDEQEFNR